MAEPGRSAVRRLGLRGRVARYPLVAFGVLACAISWESWYLSDRIDLGVVNGFGLLGSAGPALAAMIVAAVLGPEPSGARASRRVRVFAIVGALTLALLTVRRLWVTPAWLQLAGNASPETYPTPLAPVLDVLAAAVVGWIASGVYAPRRGVQGLLHSIDPRAPRVRWYWWVLAVGLYPALYALAAALAGAPGQPPVSPQAAGPWYTLALDVLLTYLLLVIHGGGLEEPGWRGFALPRLQARRGARGAIVILAALWWLWHLPLFWLQGWPGGVVGAVLYLPLEILPLTILFAAVYQRSGGSLPVVMLLHASVNLAPLFLPTTALATPLQLLVALGAAGWLWRARQVVPARQA